MNSETVNNARLFDAGAFRMAKIASDTLGAFWEGTNKLETFTLSAPEDTLLIYNQVSDVTNSNTFIAIGDGPVSTLNPVDGLDAIDAILLRLGEKTIGGSRSICEFGFQAFLDYTNVITTMDATWTAGLCSAIKNAATASNYNAHAIAAAIVAYNGDIAGYYYALDELSTGDASNMYLLAYDIQTGIAISQGVYGLTSPSGVTGTVITVGKSGSFGLNKSIYGNIKGVYGSPSSVYGVPGSIFGSN